MLPLFYGVVYYVEAGPMSVVRCERPEKRGGTLTIVINAGQKGIDAICGTVYQGVNAGCIEHGRSNDGLSRY